MIFHRQHSAAVNGVGILWNSRFPLPLFQTKVKVSTLNLYHDSLNILFNIFYKNLKKVCKCQKQFFNFRVSLQIAIDVQFSLNIPPSFSMETDSKPARGKGRVRGRGRKKVSLRISQFLSFFTAFYFSEQYHNH